MNTVLEISYLFMTVLLLALLIERVLEVLGGIWNYFEWKLKMNRFWNGKAEKLKRKFENKAKSQILLKVLDLTPLTRQLRYATRDKKEGHSGKLTIISSAMIRQSVIALSSRLIASILGVIFCAATNVNFVVIFQKAMGFEAGKLTSWPVWFQLTISGIVIGLGSEPVHSLITSMEKRRATRANSHALEKALGAKTQ